MLTLGEQSVRSSGSRYTGCLLFDYLIVNQGKVFNSICPFNKSVNAYKHNINLYGNSLFNCFVNIICSRRLKQVHKWLKVSLNITYLSKKKSIGNYPTQT